MPHNSESHLNILTDYELEALQELEAYKEIASFMLAQRVEIKETQAEVDRYWGPL